MSLVTVKRVPDCSQDATTSPPSSPVLSPTVKTSPGKSHIEFEKEFNFHNLKQIYNETKPLLVSSADSAHSPTKLTAIKPTEQTAACLISLNLNEKYFVIKDAALILPRRKQNSQNRVRQLFNKNTNKTSTEHDKSLIDDKSLFRYQNQIEQQQLHEVSNSNPEPPVLMAGSTGDILTHLKAMVQLIRPCDTISVAVKLSSYHSNKIRYLVIVETLANNSGQSMEEQDVAESQDEDEYANCCKESAILGLDLHLSNSNTSIGSDEQECQCTIGLVMPIYANCEISLNGDGGFKFKTHDSTHIFKPVSIQAMWSSYQYLHKAFENARKRNFYSVSAASMSSLASNNETPNEAASINHEWVKYYSVLINKTPATTTATASNSSSSSSLNEWYQKEERSSQREDFTTPYFDGLKLSKEEEETGIKIKEKLKEIMISSKDDYGSMSSIYIRELLEKELDLKLDSFKKFIDVTIFQFYNQLVECASQLLPYLYLGTEWNASNYDSLIADNVTHILNVSSEVDNFFPDTFKYLNIRVLDIDQTDLIKEFDRTNKFIQEAKDQSSSCLVHCKMGVSRSASVCLAYLMKEFDWSFDQAFSYIKQRRSCINPNDGFRSQLTTYESILIAHKAKRNLFEPIPPVLASPSSTQSISIQVDGNVSPTLLLPPSSPSSQHPKVSVKDTINKLKSISSSEQLITLRSSHLSPPLSPIQLHPSTSSSNSNVEISVNIKRSTSHLTTQKPSGSIKNENSETKQINNENIQLKSGHHHQRSKSSSNYDNSDIYLFNKTARQSQSWASNQFTDVKCQPSSKLKQISSNSLFMSENSLNYEPVKQVNQSASSSSSSSSIRSAIRNSLIFSNTNVNSNTNDENSSFLASGNVKRQVESINFKSRPCTPHASCNDFLDNTTFANNDITNLANMNKRQSILSLGESIAEAEDDETLAAVVSCGSKKLNLENITELVNNKEMTYVECSLSDEQTSQSSEQLLPNTTSPDGKRFKFEMTHQFQQPNQQQPINRPRKVFEFLAEKKNRQLDETSILTEKKTTLT